MQVGWCAYFMFRGGGPVGFKAVFVCFSNKASLPTRVFERISTGFVRFCFCRSSLVCTVVFGVF